LTNAFAIAKVHRVTKRAHLKGLGERIDEACTRTRLSKRELARQTGVSSALVAYWARGDHVPNAHDLGNFVRVTGVNGHWLLTGEGTPHRAMTLASPIEPAASERHESAPPPPSADESLDDLRVAALDLVRRIERLTKSFLTAKLSPHEREGAREGGSDAAALRRPDSEGRLRLAEARKVEDD
jgi:transcriptional regulator with XRE-family HTH domain